MPVLLSIADITCAFLHGEMVGEEEVFLILPEDMCPAGYRARLKVPLYGTRRASYLWGETAAKGMTSEGSVRCKGCPQLFVFMLKLTNMTIFLLDS